MSSSRESGLTLEESKPGLEVIRTKCICTRKLFQSEGMIKVFKYLFIMCAVRVGQGSGIGQSAVDSRNLSEEIDGETGSRPG